MVIGWKAGAQHCVTRRPQFPRLLQREASPTRVVSPEMRRSGPWHVGHHHPHFPEVHVQGHVHPQHIYSPGPHFLGRPWSLASAPRAGAGAGAAASSSGQAPLPLTRVCLSVGDDRARTLSLGHTLSRRSCSIWEGEAHRCCRAWMGGAEQRWGGGRNRQNPGLRWEGSGAQAYLAFLVADAPVELLPLQAQEVLPRLDDATLGRDGPGCIDVVPGHHAHCDASTLAFADSFRDLEETREVGASRSAAPSPHCGPCGESGWSALLPGLQWAGCLLHPLSTPPRPWVPPSLCWAPGPARTQTQAPTPRVRLGEGPCTLSRGATAVVSGKGTIEITQLHQPHFPLLQSCRARGGPAYQAGWQGGCVSELWKNEKGTCVPSYPARWQS